MKTSLDNKLTAWQIALVGLLVVVGCLGYFVYQQFGTLKDEITLTKEEKATLATQLKGVTQEKKNLTELSTYQQSVIDSLQTQVEKLGGTVVILEKLTQIDPELLKKYSKVFFLTENYEPAELTKIEDKYTFDGGTNFQIQIKVWPFLKNLLEASHDNGVPLLVASAYRSFDTQTSLKSEYKVVYGAGTANQFSADQGYSEHQLGTAVDFTTTKVDGVNIKFTQDPAYQWLKDNAYKYGFALSYPEDNTYYKFEPWHWRFVGVALAERLHKENKYFYDLDQRDIDVYLIKLFD